MANKTNYEDLVVGVVPLTLDDVEKLVPVVYEKTAFKDRATDTLPKKSFDVGKDASAEEIFNQELGFNAQYCRLVDMKGFYVSEETGGIGESTSSSAERSIDGLDASKIAFGTSSTVVSTEPGKDQDFIDIMKSNSRVRLATGNLIAQSIFYDKLGNLVGRGRSVQSADKKIGKDSLINFADANLAAFEMSGAKMSLPNTLVKLPNTPLLAGPQLRALGLPIPDPIADAFTIVADNDLSNPTDFSLCSPTLVSVSESNGSPVLKWLSHGHLILWDYRHKGSSSSKRHINAVKARLALNLYLTKNEYRYQTAISKSRVDGLFDGDRIVTDGNVTYKSESMRAFEARKEELLDEIKRVAFTIKTKLKVLGFKIPERKVLKYKTLTLNEQNLLLEALSGEKLGDKHQAVFIRHPNHLMALEYTLRQRAKRIVKIKNQAFSDVQAEKEARKITSVYLLTDKTRTELSAIIKGLDDIDNIWLKQEEVESSKEAYAKALRKSEEKAAAKLKKRSEKNASIEEKTEEEKKSKDKSKKDKANQSLSGDQTSSDGLSSGKENVIEKVVNKIVAKASPKKQDSASKIIETNAQKIEDVQKKNPEKVREAVQEIANETQEVREKSIEVQAKKLLKSSNKEALPLPLPEPPKRRIEFTRLDDGAEIPKKIIRTDMEKAKNTWLDHLQKLSEHEKDIDPEVVSSYNTADAEIEAPSRDMLRTALVGLLRNLPHYVTVNRRNIAESLRAKALSPLILAAVVSKRTACYQTVIDTIEATSLHIMSSVQAEALATIFAGIIPQNSLKSQMDIVKSLTSFLVRPEGPNWMFTEVPIDADIDYAWFDENAAYLKAMTSHVNTLKSAVLEAISKDAKSDKITVDGITDSVLLWAALVPYDPDLSIGSLKDSYGRVSVIIDKGKIKIEYGTNLSVLENAIIHELNHRDVLKKSKAFKDLDDLIAKAGKTSINNTLIMDFEDEPDADAENPNGVIERLKNEELLLAAALLPHKDEESEEKKTHLLQPLADKIKIAILLSASVIAVSQVDENEIYEDDSSVICTYENVVSLYERNSDARIAADNFAVAILEYHAKDGDKVTEQSFDSDEINNLMIRGKTIRNTFIDEESAPPDEILELEALLEADEDDEEEDEKNLITLDNARNVEIDLDEEVKRGAGSASILLELYNTLKDKIKPSPASKGLLEQLEDGIAEINAAKNVLKSNIVQRQAYVMAEIVKREKASDAEPKEALDQSIVGLDSSDLEDSMDEEGEVLPSTGKRQRGGFARQFYTVFYKGMLTKLDPKATLAKEIRNEIDRLKKADNAMTKRTVSTSTELFYKYLKAQQGRTEEESVADISVDPSGDDESGSDNEDADQVNDPSMSAPKPQQPPVAGVDAQKATKKEEEERRKKVAKKEEEEERRKKAAKKEEEERRQKAAKKKEEKERRQKETDRKQRERDLAETAAEKEREAQANKKRNPSVEKQSLLGDSDDELFKDQPPMPGPNVSLFDSIDEDRIELPPTPAALDTNRADLTFTARPKAVDANGLSIYNVSKRFYDTYGDSNTLPKGHAIQMGARIFNPINSKKPQSIQLSFYNDDDDKDIVLQTAMSPLYFEGTRNNMAIGIYRRTYSFGYIGSKGDLPFPISSLFTFSTDGGTNFQPVYMFPKIPAKGRVQATLRRGIDKDAQKIKVTHSYDFSDLEVDKDDEYFEVLYFKSLGDRRIFSGQIVISIREVQNDQAIIDGISVLLYEKR